MKIIAAVGLVALAALAGCSALEPASTNEQPSASTAAVTPTPTPTPSPTEARPKTYDSAAGIGTDLANGGLTACQNYSDYSGPLGKGLQTGLCGPGVFIDLFLDSAAVQKRVDDAKALNVTLYLVVGPNWTISTTEAEDAKLAAEILGGIYSETIVS